MTFKLPDTVRVGFADYKVVEMTVEEAATSDHYGITCVDSLEIRINTSIPVQKQVNVLIHEILHACWDSGDLGDTEDEEKAVTVLSIQVCQVMRDNPDLFMSSIGELIHQKCMRVFEHKPL